MIGLLNGSHFDGLKPEIITDSIVSSAIQNVSEYSYTPPTYRLKQNIHSLYNSFVCSYLSSIFSYKKTKNKKHLLGKKFEDQQEIGVRI